MEPRPTIDASDLLFWLIMTGVFVGGWILLWLGSWPPPRFQVFGALVGTIVGLLYCFHRLITWDAIAWQRRDAEHRTRTYAPFWLRIVLLGAPLGSLTAIMLIRMGSHAATDFVLFACAAVSVILCAWCALEDMWHLLHYKKR